jgi:hypothetical protein
VNLALDAALLGDWQRCKRKALIGSDWQLIKWLPRNLFNAVLRQAIFAVSNGLGVDEAVIDAETRFLGEATVPGLEFPRGSDPYVLSREWVTLVSTIVRAVAKLTLLPVRHAAPLMLSEFIDWQPLAWADEMGQLHRWITTDAWTADDLSRELHSWRTIGDVAATEAPMMLHVVITGAMIDGHIRSSWTRGWRHPKLPNFNKTRFRSPKGEPLVGWLPVWLAEDRHADHDAWVDQMASEGEVARLMRHITVDVPTKEQCLDIRREMVTEGEAMRWLINDRMPKDWAKQPMSRGACDIPRPCPFQEVCYGPKAVDISTLGRYKPVKSNRQEVQPCPPSMSGEGR